MWDTEHIKLPVTLVNEYNSSQMAKSQIAKLVTQSMNPVQTLIGQKE